MVHYQVVNMPNTTRFMFDQVFSALDHYGKKATVVTLDSKNLLFDCIKLNVQVICRIQENGSVLEDTELLKKINEAKPEMLVLDDCFWNDEDSFLLSAMLRLSETIPDLGIINVQQLSSPKTWKHLKRAQRIYCPVSLFNLEINDREPLPITFYDEKSLYPKSKTASIPSPVSSVLYKRVFIFYQSFHNIRCLTEMDIFSMFLRQLNEETPDKLLLLLFTETRKYCLYGEVKNNRDLGSTFITEYIRLVNHIIFSIVQTNEPLFQILSDFFTPIRNDKK